MPIRRTGATLGMPPGRSNLLRIGELADEFGITTRAIRFYEAHGLSAGPARRSSAPTRGATGRG